MSLKVAEQSQRTMCSADSLNALNFCAFTNLPALFGARYISIRLAGRRCTMQRPWSSGSSSSIYKSASNNTGSMILCILQQNAVDWAARGGELCESMQHAHATYRNASRKLRPANVFVWRLAHSAPAPVHMRDGLEVLQLNADADGEHFVLERALITCALAAASCARQLT